MHAGTKFGCSALPSWNKLRKTTRLTKIGLPAPLNIRRHRTSAHTFQSANGRLRHRSHDLRWVIRALQTYAHHPVWFSSIL